MNLFKHILKNWILHKKQWFEYVVSLKKNVLKSSLLAHNQTSPLLVWWIYQFQSRMCVLMLQDGLLQEQLAAPRHDGQLVLHVEMHQMADTQEHLIMGPHLHTHTHTHTVALHVTSSPSVRPVPTPQALPVRVHQPAAGGARCLPPYHWEHTGQRLSCSLWPGSLHCRWGGTLPALVLTWGRGFKVKGRGTLTL